MNKKHAIGYTATALLALGIGAASSGSGEAISPAAAQVGTTTTGTTPRAEVTLTAPAVTKTIDVPGPTKTVKVGPPPPAVAMPGDGTFQVGVDVKAGTYVSKASPTGNCYWARLKNSGGGFDAIIANGNSSGQVVVTIRKTDKFFEANGCSDWTRR